MSRRLMSSAPVSARSQRIAATANLLNVQFMAVRTSKKSSCSIKWHEGRQRRCSVGKWIWKQKAACVSREICFNNCEPGNVFDAMRGGTTHTFDCGSRIFNKKYELKDTCRRKEARNWNIYIHVSFLQGAACARCDGSDVTWDLQLSVCCISASPAHDLLRHLLC